MGIFSKNPRISYHINMSRYPAVPRFSFATRYAHIVAHIFAHIFATGNEIQKYFCFDPKLRESSFNLGARVENCIIMHPRARANLRANTIRGDVHCKQNCFRRVMLFKILFAEFSRSFVSNLVAKLSRGTGLLGI